MEFIKNKRVTFYLGGILFASLLHGGVCIDESKYPNPARFESKLEAFSDLDHTNPPEDNAILCIGSSSMHGWHETIREDLAPLTVIPRGIGGSNMNDIVHYLDKIVFPYHPRAILVYEGDNDLAMGLSPVDVIDSYRVFEKLVHSVLPECRIYFMAIKPSVRRESLLEQQLISNRFIETFCETDDRLIYIDVASPMLNGDGLPKPELFKEDQLHMARAGYKLWRDAVYPVLEQGESSYEMK